MSASTRLSLGLASLLPAAALAGLPRLAEAAASRADPGGLILVSLGLSLIGLGAVLTFVWMAGGLRRPLTERMVWVLALTGFGVVTAPAFWYLHVRTPRPVPAASS